MDQVGRQDRPADAQVQNAAPAPEPSAPPDGRALPRRTQIYDAHAFADLDAAEDRITAQGYVRSPARGGGHPDGQICRSSRCSSTKRCCRWRCPRASFSCFSTRRPSKINVLVPAQERGFRPDPAHLRAEHGNHERPVLLHVGRAARPPAIRCETANPNSRPAKIAIGGRQAADDHRRAVLQGTRRGARVVVWSATNAGFDRKILEPTINRPGLALSGFFKYFACKRIQVIGSAEMSYLKSLSSARRRRCGSRALCARRIPCVVVFAQRGHSTRVARWRPSARASLCSARRW